MILDVVTSSKALNKKDLTWKYNYLKAPKDTNLVTLLFCWKEAKGGIFKAKQYQIEKRKCCEVFKMSKGSKRRA